MKNLEGQFVCQKCGYNMIEHYPKFCPFCGASNENFITAKKCSQKYKLVSSKVNDKVTRLYSFPTLGLEHSAYSLFQYSESKRVSRLLFAIAAKGPRIRLGRISIGSRTKEQVSADPVARHWIGISNTARSVGSEYDLVNSLTC